MFADPPINDDIHSRSNVIDGHKFIDKSLELEMGWAVDQIDQGRRNKS